MLTSSRSSEDIGSWSDLLSLLTYMAIFMNSVIVAFTGDFALNFTWSDRAWIWIGMSVGLVVLKVLVTYIVSKVPEEVTIQLQRAEFIEKILMKNLVDEKEKVVTARVLPSFQIQVIFVAFY